MTHESSGPVGYPPWLRRCCLFGGALVVVLGLYLRLDSMAASLWIDEFGTLWVVERDFTTTLLRSWQFQGQSPLYYVIAWIPIHAVGESEVALRAPSLVLGCLFVVALYACGRILAGPRAGCFAAVLGWLSPPSVHASVTARPYVLALLGVAMATAGFQWSVRSGHRTARTLWIVGGATVAWSHYLQYPVVVGLFVAYALLPDLRVKYTKQQFIVDGLLQLGLVALCIPQLLTLLARTFLD
jgi:mannosyltransferase